MALAPPRPKGPPLNALRALEAAARHGSFAAAAEELSVTPGAISQQIKSVEEWAGTSLFERRAHGVALTAAGAAVAPGLAEAFDAIGAATNALRSFGPRPTLHIATLPSVAQLWLQSRLARLRDCLPHHIITVTALEAPPDLARGLFDCSLFFAQSHACGIVLAEDRLFPVCTPAIAERLAHPEDVLDETLIIDDSWSTDWPDWLARFDLSIPSRTRTLHHSLYALALAEAQAGQGVLIGHAPLVAAALDAGDLVRPFGTERGTDWDKGNALILKQANAASDPDVAAALEQSFRT